MLHDVGRWLLLAAALALAACGPPPRPFQPDQTDAPIRRPPAEKAELAIAAPRNMPPQLGQRVAAALAMELQSYGIVAAVQPAEAPIQVNGVMSTRDAEQGIEIQIDWSVAGAARSQEPLTSRTRARPEDYGEANDRLVSRIAQQAAPRVATLIGKPPTFQARSIGQVAAGLSVAPEEPREYTQLSSSSVPNATQTAAAAAQPKEQQVKVQVAPVTGAPSDGNKQLFSGMRRALGSSKIVIVDAPGNDVFTVVGAVSLTPIDDRMGQLVVKWYVKDPSGKTVGDIEQANPVPLAAAKGSWAGFGDIVATAASEGVLQLLEKAMNRPRP
ncbi:hypothetical protein [Reyranella sp.]|uniref:hypothetical protein n=1 Tax=Reyranella sp. TaxID=1929291 RepID=UPI003BACFC87